MKKETKISQNYSGFYRGIVIDNADPDTRGRVKIFLPEFATTIINKVGLPNDIAYEVKFVGTSPLLSGEALEYAKRVCQWAEQASPLVGGGSAGYIVDGNVPTVADNLKANSQTRALAANGARIPTGNTGVIGPIGIDGPTGEERNALFDNLQPDQALPITGGASLSAEELLNQLDKNLDGSSQGASIMPKGQNVKGAHNGRSSSNAIHSHNDSSRPSLYPNATKGLFSVPDIGANVWVFFENSNPNCPVYFAYMYDQNDWAGIHTINSTNNGYNYPRNTESNIYRSQTVITNRGGALTMTGTEGSESVELAAHHGSAINLTKSGIQEIVGGSGNKTSIIQNNVFATIKGGRNVNTARNSDEVVGGDRYVKVGAQDEGTIKAYKTWVENDTKLAKIQALPDLQPTLATPKIVTKKIKYTVFPETLPILVNNKVAQGVLNYIKPKPQEISIDIPVGVGNSKTTQGGPEVPNPAKANVAEITKLVASQQAPIEKTLGEGGSEYKIIAKNKTEIVGAVANIRKSVIITENGKEEIQGIKLGTYGFTFPKKAPFRYAKSVGQDPFVCGNSSVTVNNRYSLLVGSGGISIGTFGVMDICSEITSIAGLNELNLSSEHSINIKGKCINISNGDDSVDGALVLKSPDQVVVDCNLGVSRNVIVGGGMSVEGQLCVKAISAPAELQLTKETVAYAETVQGAIIGYCNGSPVYGGTLAGIAEPNSIKVYKHLHEFFNLPLTLHQSSINVADPKQFNDPKEVVPASPVQNGDKKLIPTNFDFETPGQ